MVKINFQKHLLLVKNFDGTPDEVTAHPLFNIIFHELVNTEVDGENVTEDSLLRLMDKIRLQGKENKAIEITDGECALIKQLISAKGVEFDHKLDIIPINPAYRAAIFAVLDGASEGVDAPVVQDIKAVKAKEQPVA